MLSLPIDSLLPDVVASLRVTNRLVVQAPPGSGKTTRLPRALLDADVARGGEIVVLEPRRLAARYAARRVAEELGEPVGHTVGYQVRFEDVSSSATRIRFMTAGVFLNRVLHQQRLEGIGAVVVDEFHERSVQADTALALARDVQKKQRPDLQIVLMSATVEGKRVADTFDAPLLRAEGRSYEVALHYDAQLNDRSLPLRVARAVREAMSHEADGHVLVFLPGVKDIHQCRIACQSLAEQGGLRLLPLHGEASPAEQDRAFAPSEQRKVIFATNVAESSVTIDGISVVIDSGLARVAVHSPWSGYGSLRTSPISRASADQRAGRAGRTRSGHCIRLYTASDYERRPAHDKPEVLRLDLTATILLLRAQGLDPQELPWFDAPPVAAVDAATTLLKRLGAVDEQSGLITDLGQRMARLPISPRSARLLVDAETRGAAKGGAYVAAMLEERDVLLSRRTGPSDGRNRSMAKGTSDMLTRLDDVRAAHGLTPPQMVHRGLDPNAVATVERSKTQLLRHLARTSPKENTIDEEEALLRSLLQAYPDRVARRRKAGGRELIVVGGTTAMLGEDSVVQDAPFLLALNVHESGERQGGTTPLVRMASRIEADWLLEQFPERVHEEQVRSWNDTAERVDLAERLVYDGLVLDESKVAAPVGSATTAVLAEAARKKGLRAFVDPPAALDRWLGRVRFLARVDPAFPAFDDAMLQRSMDELCAGRRSFAELRAANLFAELEGHLPGSARAALARGAPEGIELPGGRRAVVEYPENASPFVASRLQNFFGLRALPTLAGGRVPLLVQLLAPNGRAVQITANLAGFWVTTYPSVRQELRRRYPRHPWPEDPTVVPPPSTVRRGSR